MNFLLKGQQIDVPVRHVVNAGYAGCDQRVVKAHIDELASIGVSVPKRTPTFYPVPVMQLTQSSRIQVGHGRTSAEIEYVFIQSEGNQYITVGSDHSDRALETYSVNAAKQICPDIVASQVWEYKEVRDHFSDLILTCEVCEQGAWRIYQQGAASAILMPEQLLELGQPITGEPQDGTVLYSGTIPTIGEITYADRWKISLCDQKLHRSIQFEYEVEVLPECIE